MWTAITANYYINMIIIQKISPILRFRQISHSSHATIATEIDWKGENAMLGMRIAFLRIGKGWSREELARRVGCSARTVYLCERGRHKPSSDMLLRLAEEFGMTTDYLLTGEMQQFDSSEMLEEPHITVRIEALIQYLSTTSE